MKNSLIALVVIAGLGPIAEAKSSRPPLKANVQIGHIRGQTVTLPDGQVADFEYLANQLFYGQVLLSEHFTIMNPIPNMSPANASELRMLTGKSQVIDAYSQIGDFDPSDLALLEQFGFLRQLEKKSRALGGAYSKGVADEDIPACLYNTPEYELNGSVNSFAMTYGGGLCIGYGTCGSGGLNPGWGGKLSVQQSKLDLSIRADNALTKQVDMYGSGVKNTYNINIGVQFPTGIPIGLEFFSKTKIVETVRKAFDKALSTVVDNYIKMREAKDWNQAWQAKVSYEPELVDNDTFIAIRAGSRNNVKQGDRFKVYNMVYKWTDPSAPCSSALDYSIPSSREPVAIVEAWVIGGNITSAKVVEQLRDERIQPGAIVMIE